jgi:hypothetical protein
MNIVESKPTPIDKPAVMDYVEMLADDILVAAREATDEHENDYIDDNDVLLESEFKVVDVKTKAWRTFPVIVRSIVNSEKINQGPLVVGAGAGDVDGQFIVEIVIEGAYTWQKLKELRQHFVKELYTTLLHELTHAADHAYDNKTSQLGRPPYMAKDGVIDDVEYWNDPRELRAFLQEVVEESLARAETFVRAHRKENITREQVLEYVYEGKMWKQTAKFMNERNRAKILKAVYAALVDAGWI